MAIRPLVPLTPARAARRQLLRDRMAELLDDWGAQFPVERAGQLLALVEQLGFRLPAGIEDPPPVPGPSSAEVRIAALAEIRATLAARRGGRDTNPSQLDQTQPNAHTR